LFVENSGERRNPDVSRNRNSPIEVVTELQSAVNKHDLDAMAACFTPDYESEFPAHPDRSFRGLGQMRKNWSQIFGAVPDIEAVLLRATSSGDTVWAEWEWRGTRTDGSSHVMRGVTVQSVKQDRIEWVRLYMEPVQVGAGTDAAIREHLSTRRS
jgi:ketosteroid isomerase-like protein